MAEKQRTYLDGDVVLIRGTIKTVRGQQRVSFKKGEARTLLSEVEVVNTETQVLKPGDLIDYDDPNKPGEGPRRATIRKSDGGDLWARFDGDGTEGVIAAKYAKRVD